MGSPLVVGFDGSPESIDALAAAADLAALSGRGVIVVHVRHANALLVPNRALGRRSVTPSPSSKPSVATKPRS